MRSDSHHRKFAGSGSFAESGTESQSGGFCVSDYVESMANDVFTNEELVFAKTPEEFEKLVSYYVNNPEERLPYIQRGYESVLRNHTYFHRIADLFNELQMPEQAKKCLEALEKMIEE